MLMLLLADLVCTAIVANAKYRKNEEPDVTPQTLPLFDDPDAEQREARLRAIFQSWIAHRARSTSTVRGERPLREESATVYQEMWHAFAAYCASRNLDLPDIEAEDLVAFLMLRGVGGNTWRPRPTSASSASLSLRYAWRMLNLIDRVTCFQAQRECIPGNPAARDLLQRPQYRYANASNADPLPEYLSEEQARGLIAYLTALRTKDSPDGPMSWKEVRDRTAVALMLGAGLAPGDVRVLALDGVIVDGGSTANLPWKLVVPGNGNAPARETPIAEWAGRQLAFWLTVRAEQQIPGTFVFPSTRAGRAWSHTGCFESCKAVLAAAGPGQETGGVFKLRHTFALRQLTKGKSEVDVAKWLGLVDLNSMARYRRIIPRPIDVA